ncbi:MAG TPA: hypothetical protein PK264_05210 [Hyphomicrobiaceae bacterium]|nr:hypothetical protein [Hyphomicrobiaceae bacterium]
MSDNIICRTRRFLATTTHVTSRSSTFTLANVEHVKLRRPWLPFAVIGAGGLAATAAVFTRELYDHELIGIWSFGAAAIVASFRIGRLQLISLALHDQDAVVWGPIGELRAVKSAIETALIARSSASSDPPRLEA